MHLCSWIGRHNIIKMATHLKLTRFHTILTKIPTAHCAEIDKLILNFTWKYKGPRRVKNNIVMEKES